jgi:hypothetical protein
LSTFHDRVTTLDSEKKNKPEEILFYNMTKRGIDTLDKLCATYSVQRWSTVLFDLVTNIITVNGMFVFNQVNQNHLRDKKKIMGEDLVKAHMSRRAEKPQMTSAMSSA